MLRVQKLLCELREAQRATYPPVRRTSVHWTAADVREARWLYSEGHSFPVIAQRLKRTVSAVESKLYLERRKTCARNSETRETRETK